jgi:hypothetical protein
MGKTRQTANLVTDNNIFADVNNDKVGIGTTNAVSKLTVAGDVSVSGVITATSFSGSFSGSVEYANTSGIATYSSTSGIATYATSSGIATYATTAGVSTVADTLSTDATGTNLTLSGNLTVNGTQTIINTTTLDVSDKTVGIASTSSPTDSNADGAGIVIYGDTNKSLVWKNDSDSFTFSDGVDIKGAVETVSVASTYSLGGGKFLLECNAQNGTVFTHTIPTGGNIGIVSFKNFAATKNSVTTFTILITQNSAGTGNTTAVTGVGTNIRLWPIGASSGLTTSSRVSTASTLTMSSTGNDIDILTFAVHYNGSGAATTSNYTVFGSDVSSFRFGNIKP